MSVALAPYSIHHCPRCNQTVPEDVATCKRGHDCGTINVRIARGPAEAGVLDQHYTQAHADLAGRGLGQEAQDFEDAVKQRARAVVNTYPGFVKNLGKDPGALYLNYYERRDQKIDAPTYDHIPRNRGMADAYAYSGYGEKLRFAALSLTECGLPSYGPVSLILKNRILEDRACLLESNSYEFLARHYNSAPAGSVFKVEDPPAGRRSDWRNRHKLALFKHAADLQQGMKGDAFDQVVLSAGATRGEDRFIEIGIYDPFGLESIEEIHAPNPKPGDPENDVLEDAADLIGEKNIPWHWHDR